MTFFINIPGEPFEAGGCIMPPRKKMVKRRVFMRMGISAITTAYLLVVLPLTTIGCGYLVDRLCMKIPFLKTRSLSIIAIQVYPYRELGDVYYGVEGKRGLYQRGLNLKEKVLVVTDRGDLSEYETNKLRDDVKKLIGRKDLGIKALSGHGEMRPHRIFDVPEEDKLVVPGRLTLPGGIVVSGMTGTALWFSFAIYLRVRRWAVDAIRELEGNG
jgi:hypothetical protein